MGSGIVILGLRDPLTLLDNVFLKFQGLTKKVMALRLLYAISQFAWYRTEKAAVIEV